MKLPKQRRKTLSPGAKTLPIGAVIAGLAALGGLFAAYLRWFRPGVAAELTGAPAAPDHPASPGGDPARDLAGRFHGLDDQHAATHYPPSLERDPKNIEQAIHEG
jgi:hypothetical protein